MSLFKRMWMLFQQKLAALMDRAEDPNQALDFAYQKQLENLQQVRRSVADVLTSEKRLEMQASQLSANVSKLNTQAQQALSQNREDLARLALARAQDAKNQLDGLNKQIAQMKAQEEKLEEMARKLQAKVEAFRTQKETIKAQYTAAQAATRIGEVVTGISEEVGNMNLAIDRAQEKTTQMQARSAAIEQLIDSGTLDSIGANHGDDIQRQLDKVTTNSAVDGQLELMKAKMRGALPSGVILRIEGEDQYRLPESDRDKITQLDNELVALIEANNESGFKGKMVELLSFVRSRGVVVPADQIVASTMLLPRDDMSMQEARNILKSTPEHEL